MTAWSKVYRVNTSTQKRTAGASPAGVGKSPTGSADAGCPSATTSPAASARHASATRPLLAPPPHHRPLLRSPGRITVTSRDRVMGALLFRPPVAPDAIPRLLLHLP